MGVVFIVECCVKGIHMAWERYLTNEFISDFLENEEFWQGVPLWLGVTPYSHGSMETTTESQI
jgi:hypothetical protein